MKKKNVFKKIMVVGLILSLLATTMLQTAMAQETSNEQKLLLSEKQLKELDDNLSKGNNIPSKKTVKITSNQSTSRVGEVTDEATLSFNPDPNNNQTTMTLSINKTLGSKMLNDFSADLLIYDVNGNFLSKQTLTETPDFLYKTFTIDIPMKSVFEYIIIQNAKVDFDNLGIDDTHYFENEPNNYNILGGRLKQYGGKYSGISAMGGERHHCFSTYVYDKTTVYKFGGLFPKKISKYGEAPVILMTIDDHQKTASWGSAGADFRSEQLTLVKKGFYLAAMQKDIDDIRLKFGSRYDKAITSMYTYAKKTLGWKK